MNILKKAVACFTIAAALVGSASVSASAATYPCVGIVVANTVNVRSGPGTNHYIEAVVDYGQTLDVFAKTDNWYKIGTGGGNYAYISADYVSIRPEDVAARGNMSGGNRVLQLAKKYLGTPYVYGGSSPSGFDCSGFAFYF